MFDCVNKFSFLTTMTHPKKPLSMKGNKETVHSMHYDGTIIVGGYNDHFVTNVQRDEWDSGGESGGEDRNSEVRAMRVILRREWEDMVIKGI